MKVATLALRFVGLLGLLLLADCSQQSVVTQLRSLSGSEDAVFLCRDDRGVGHPFSDCPDRDATDDTRKADHLSVFALVSQTVTDEVAVVNVTAGSVVDVDPSTPGFGFLRVGAKPVSMAATPGGFATFVATAEVGRNGIFALPTNCLSAPTADEYARDLTSWPACRLPGTPGEMAVLVEPDSTDPGSVPASCNLESYAKEAAGAAGAADQQQALGCHADLTDEQGSVGRRKIVVALPDTSELVVLDAQELLKTPAGTFPDCVIEQHIPLSVNVPPGVAQRLPADLATTCTEDMPPTAPVPGMRAPQPAGFAVADDKLYIADQAAPVVHVMDTTSVCGMTELPSLLPMSLREPQRIVTTRRVAVSPLTPAGKRFAYAIDDEDQPGASVMIFDVSPDSTDPTPLVREGAPELPGEKPDRLALGSSAKDVTFAYRDIPYVDPATGVATFGTRCDPNPNIDPASPAALARPSTDNLSGARPGLLRGLYGFILLTNGQIAIVDIDDFDAACRRPLALNQSGVTDFRGCPPDKIKVPPTFTGTPAFADGFNLTGARFVTAEESCRVIEPHRFRSLRFDVNNATVGVHAPSLRGFPQLTLPTTVTNTAAEDHPRLLAVPFPADVKGNPATTDVWVGTTLYSTDVSGDQVLPTDPNDRRSDLLESLNSVVLPPLEPRSYAADDVVTVTYEGSYAGDRTAGILDKDLLEDDSLSFCNAGVYDTDAMAAYATEQLGVPAENAKAFAELHADYVQLLTAIPNVDDKYWTYGPVKYVDCATMFGPTDATPLSESRNFSIVSAFSNHLKIKASGAAGAPTLDDVQNCFPTPHQYRLRVGGQWALTHTSSGFKHDVVEDANHRCVRSCSPLKKWAKGRVFEIASTAVKPGITCRRATTAADTGAGGASDGADNGITVDDPLELRVGCADEGELGCVYDQTSATSAAAQLADKPGCIYDGLNDRFALYRGRAKSVPDAAFTWQTTGGFTPLLMSLGSLSTVVAPQTIQFLQQPEQMAVVDGASQGLSLFSLDTFAVVAPSPFY